MSILYGIFIINAALGIFEFVQVVCSYISLHRVALSPSSDRRQGTHTIQGFSFKVILSEPRALSPLGSSTPGRVQAYLPGCFRKLNHREVTYDR